MAKISKIIIPILFGILFLILLFIFLGTSNWQNYFPKKINLSQSQEEKILEELTLKEKVGQLFLIGFKGRIFNSELKKIIETIQPGGVILLSRNIENSQQIKKLIDELQGISLKEIGLPLFIAVDQEGGPISRIEFLEEKTLQSEISTINQAKEIGLRRGKELKELGLNLNLAPVLDFTTLEDFLFNRSFQKDFKEAGNLGQALILGQKQAGILTAMKHFPGYGGISFDPEKEKVPFLAEIPEISQFQIAFEAQPEMIMTANVIYSEIDRTLPFSFSPLAIQFLKKELPGNYLIISDDLSSPVLKKEFSLKNSVILAFRAGLDILLVAGFEEPSDPLSAYNFFWEAVENQGISEKRIDQSVLKIIHFKENLLK